MTHHELTGGGGGDDPSDHFPFDVGDVLRVMDTDRGWSATGPVTHFSHHPGCNPAFNLSKRHGGCLYMETTSYQRDKIEVTVLEWTNE